MRRFVTTIVSLSIIGSALIVASGASAADCTGVGNDGSFGGSLRRVACGAGYIQGNDATPITQETVITIIANFISVLLGLTGIVFVGFLIYGGYLWMTARGNSETVQDAENLIRNCIIGIVIIFADFTISRFVLINIGQSIFIGQQ